MSLFLQGLQRYLSLDELEKISHEIVGIAGCGGIGSNVAIALARSGYRQFVIADHDNIDISNLNRQAFTLKDVGKTKVDVLRSILQEIDPLIRVSAHAQMIDASLIQSFYSSATIVVEAFDIAFYKQMFLEKLSGSGKFLVMANGMAGLSNENKIHIQRVNDHCYWVGDGVTEVGKSNPPLAPRVFQCAGLMASVVLEHTLSGKVSSDNL